LTTFRRWLTVSAMGVVALAGFRGAVTMAADPQPVSLLLPAAAEIAGGAEGDRLFVLGGTPAPTGSGSCGGTGLVVVKARVASAGGGGGTLDVILAAGSEALKQGRQIAELARRDECAIDGVAWARYDGVIR